MTERISVLGGSGFVGSAVTERLRTKGAQVSVVRAPRLTCSPNDVHGFADAHPQVVQDLATDLAGSTVVINCAGDPDASSMDVDRLFGANGALPGVIARASAAAGLSRYIHVSSAVVQGSTKRLDESEATSTTSPYGHSKAVGESLALSAPAPTSTIVFRPPSVHGAERRVTKMIRRLAASPVASVVGDGSAPTPQAHITNVADAIATLALTRSTPPRVVIHPSEGWTTGELMEFFGDGHKPLRLPQGLSPVIVQALRLASRSERLAPNARRVEMMWFGQEQATSWLTTAGWTPPAGRAEWRAMLDLIDNAPTVNPSADKEAHD